MPLDNPRDGAARCGDIIIYSALIATSPPLRPMRPSPPSPAWSAALLRPRASSPRWTPPRSATSSSSSSSSTSTSSSYDSSLVVEARRGRGAALLRVRPPRAPLAGLLLLLLDLVVVVALLDLVLVRLLFSGARPEAWRGRGRGLCVAERWGGAVDVLEILRRGSNLALASSKFFGVSSALTSS